MAGNLPSLSPVKVVKALKKAGFVEVRQKGSHLILFNDSTGRRVKGKDIKKPLLRKIIEIESLMSLEDFLKLL